MQRALDASGVKGAAWIARRLIATRQRTWEIDMLAGALGIGVELDKAPALVDALGAGEEALVAALFEHREVGKRLDGWLETYPWLTDDPFRLEAERWQAHPVQVLSRIAAWRGRAAGLKLQAPGKGSGTAELERVKGWGRRRFLDWAIGRARALQPVSRQLMLQLLGSAGRIHGLLSNLGYSLERKGVLAEARDVHFMTWEECVGWVLGSSPSTWLRETASYRKAEASLFAGLGPAVTLVETTGPVHAGNPLRGALGGVGRDAERFSGWSVGAPVVGGGQVCPANTASTLAPGSSPVLVGERGSPGWVLDLPAASGVVLELDGAGGSVARMGRWLGIPVLVRVPGASALLKEGEHVELDGRNGQGQRQMAGA